MKNLKWRRVFNIEFKKEKVSLIKEGKVRISEICKVYAVSETAVRKWLCKCGKLEKTERMVVNKIRHCIHHSDAGSQYKSIKYKKILGKTQMLMSIASNCLENGMAEQLNGVLKNDYIIKEVRNGNDLNKQLKEIMRLINEERPVKELKYKTPVAFENRIAIQDYKPKIRLYDFKKTGDFGNA